VSLEGEKLRVEALISDSKGPRGKMDHQVECDDLLLRARIAFKTRKARWTRKQREAYELLAAALGYQALALCTYTASLPHAKIRERTWPFDEWPRGSGTPLRIDPAVKSDVLANMHFASVSFRLVTASFKVAETRRAARDSFTGGPWFRLTPKKQLRDWNRDTAEGLFKKVKRIVCCTEPSAVPLCKEEAMTVLLMHRDEFGHGEA
jgi:hypothetical protein